MKKKEIPEKTRAALEALALWVQSSSSCLTSDSASSDN
jgi:hypothetical protein